MPKKVREAVKVLCAHTSLSEHRQCVVLLENSFAGDTSTRLSESFDTQHLSYVTLRLPAGLHAKIKSAAVAANMSMNNLINGCLYDGAKAGKKPADMSAHIESILASHLPEEVFLDLKGEAHRSDVSMFVIAASRIRHAYSIGTAQSSRASSLHEQSDA